MSDFVTIERSGGIAHLVLNRPDRHNSLIPELLDELLAGLRQVDQDANSRVVLLTARGRNFSTGGDLRGFLAHWDAIEAYSRRVVGRLNDVMMAMVELRVPVVAAVQGWVTGGSLGLVLASDLVLLAADARFAPYYTEVGYSPDGGWAALLPRIVGDRAAAEVQYLNRPFDAAEAVRWGLANRVVDGEALASEARKTAERIAGMVPGSVESTKRVLRRDAAAWRDGLEQELEAFVRRITSPDARGGVEAFLERMKTA